MKFMVVYTIKPGNMASAVARFLKTGGLPPKGVKLIRRLHGAGIGFVEADTKDGKAPYEWTAQWSDQLEFAIHPVVEDRDAAAVLKRTYK